MACLVENNHRYEYSIYTNICKVVISCNLVTVFPLSVFQPLYVVILGRYKQEYSYNYKSVRSPSSLIVVIYYERINTIVKKVFIKISSKCIHETLYEIYFEA